MEADASFLIYTYLMTIKSAVIAEPIYLVLSIKSISLKVANR